MIRKLIFSLYLLLIACSIQAQQENVPIDHDVYTFLKEMSVKRIIANVHDDNPSMSRAEVEKHLKEIASKRDELSKTEKGLLKKYEEEFYDENEDSTNTYQMFKGNNDNSSDMKDLFSDKIKYIYAYQNDDANAYLNILGRGIYGTEISPKVPNTELFDIGFRFRGTFLDNFGYDIGVTKGAIEGNHDFAAILDPRMKFNFQYYQSSEVVNSYDFAEGYLRYYTEPSANMNIALELGREKMKFGYGYGDKLILSGNGPDMNFIKFDFNYGIISFSSWQASTVGENMPLRIDDYTKFMATNKLKLSFKNLFDIGIGGSVIYSGRGLDLAYANPLQFIKFTEQSEQDKDNCTIWYDFQTHFLKNLEFQGTLFLDDDLFSTLKDLSNTENRSGYQIGMFWYSAFAISDLSLVLEYTRIRPFTYGYDNPKDTYTAFGQILGDQIGPNSDEILLRANYNVSPSIRLNCDYKYIRHGDNIYDAQGNLTFNSGGDVFVYTGVGPNNTSESIFLSGERINTNVITVDLKYEPIRKVFFDLVFNKIWQMDATKDILNITSYAYLQLMFEI
jgi:hypothetical protein